MSTFKIFFPGRPSVGMYVFSVSLTQFQLNILCQNLNRNIQLELKIQPGLTVGGQTGRIHIMMRKITHGVANDTQVYWNALFPHSIYSTGHVKKVYFTVYRNIFKKIY